MKHLHYLLTATLLFLCSCTQSTCTDSPLLSEEEQAKVERITKHALEHGWEFDSTYTESEIIQDILQMDEEEFYTVVQICDALKKADEDISE